MAEKKQVNNNEVRENTSPKKKMSPGKVVLIGSVLVFIGLSQAIEGLCTAGGITLSNFSIVFGVFIIIAGVVYNFLTLRENKKK